MAGNSIQLVSFGHNVFNYFSSKFESGDYFFLTVDEKIFNELLTYKFKIIKESLLKNFADTGFEYDTISGEDKGLIAIAIASYQVLLASESKGTKSRDTFTAFYNIVPNEKIKKIWYATKEYFQKYANLNLCLPSNDNANYVSYPNYQVLNNTLLKNLFYSCYLLKLPVKDSMLDFNYFDRISQKYKYKLTYIEKLIIESYPKASLISYKNLRKIFAFFLYINYLEWDGSSPTINDIPELDTQYEIDEIFDDNVIALCPEDKFQFYVYNGNNHIDGNIKDEVLKQLSITNYIVFIYNTQYKEFENTGSNNFDNENIYLLTYIQLGMDENIVKKYIFNENDLNLYYFSFKDNPDHKKYHILKSRLGHTNKGQGISLLGGIKIGNQYLEGCGPDYLDLEELVPIKTLTAGTNIISIPNASNTIKISIVPRIKTKQVYNETAFNIPNSNFTLVNGFCTDLPEIKGEEKEIQKLDGLVVNDFFDHLMSIKYRYLNTNSECYSTKKRFLYGR
ncbi:MAG: hypothetical protein UHO11_04110 [Treponema sp.]|nr:hypothetical protein [Treponema sp.]